MIGNKEHYFDAQKRLEKQQAEFLAEHYRNIKEAEEKALNEKQNILASSINLAYNSANSRRKARTTNLMEQIRYTENASVIGMKKVITEIVLESLLLDRDQYEKLNPNYVQEINEMVEGFLKNANINESVNREETLALMESVAKALPDKETGKYLTEAQIEEYVPMKDEDVQKIIKKLSKDVKKDVAKMIDKEKSRIDKIQKEIDELAEVNAVEESDPVAETEVADGAAPVEEVAAEEVPVEEGTAVAEAPIEGEEVVENPVEGEVVADPANGAQIQIAAANVKNKINVTIALEESGNGLKFYRDPKRQGLFETLTTNEAAKMIREGKEYNSDLAMANALTYITILETFNVMNLLEVNENDIKKITKLAGGEVESNVQKANMAARNADAKKNNEKEDKDEKKEETTEKVFSRDEVRKELEKAGYDLAVDSFDEVFANEGFKKINSNQFIKK